MATPSWWGPLHQLNDSKDACALMTATTPLLQRQGCQLDDYSSLTMAESPLQQWQTLPLQWQQRCLHINGNNAIVMRAKMPLRWWRGRLCIDDDDNTIATRGQCQLEEGNDTIMVRATMQLQIKGDNTIVMRVMMPSIGWQGCLPINNGNDTIIMRATIAITTMAKTLCIDGNNTIVMRAMMPAWWQATKATMLAQQWQRHACASTTATSPSWQEQQLPSGQWQRRLCIDGNDASLTMSNKGNNMNDDRDAIATRAMTPAWGRQWHHHDKGNNAIVDQRQQRHCYESHSNSSMMERMPAHWQLQQCHCHEGENCNGNNCKDAWALTAMTPSWRGQQCQLNDEWRGQRC
jgi:hypothetical protein